MHDWNGLRCEKVIRAEQERNFTFVGKARAESPVAGSEARDQIGPSAFASSGFFLDGLCVLTVIGGRIQGGIDQHLAVVEEGQAGVREEVHIIRTAVQDHEDAFSLEDGQQVDALVSEPKRLDGPAAALEVLACVDEHVEHTLGAKLAEGQEV